MRKSSQNPTHGCLASKLSTSTRGSHSTCAIPRFFAVSDIHCSTKMDYESLACDLAAFILLYDEYTDKVDSDGARIYADMVMDALRNPHIERPQGESKLGEIARQYFHSVLFKLQACRLGDVSSQDSRSMFMV
ncbi:hypothetical protein BJV78DRAFT_744897 [Lactifluus subvellereus]|nr:hypothetical protein BJV78DRAFT_744897 [Lactifluus subvellereus]